MSPVFLWSREGQEALSLPILISSLSRCLSHSLPMSIAYLMFSHMGHAYSNKVPSKLVLQHLLQSFLGLASRCVESFICVDDSCWVPIAWASLYATFSSTEGMQCQAEEETGKPIPKSAISSMHVVHVTYLRDTLTVPTCISHAHKWEVTWILQKCY